VFKEDKILVHLIPELGGLQVYCFQTTKEIVSNTDPKEIYWRDRDNPQGYGPFPTIYDALSHYKVLTSVRKEDANLGNLIKIDFIIKKRLNPIHS
jgi:hypothetical protein